MPPPEAVLAHLLEGRAELLREVERLTTAITELDAVIARVDGTADGASSPTGARAPASAPTRAASRGRGARAGSPRSTARRAAARPRASRGAAAPGHKSIRVHVLDMLTAEPRDFAMSEIIERVHAAGIDAHDDAVRSITTKLMKDGRVERVGRGRYRLTPG